MIRAAAIAVLALPVPSALPGGTGGCLTGLTYADAIVHAGAVDYVFAIADGADLLLRIENGAGLGSEFAGLVAAGDGEPAGADAAQLGRAFDICLNGGDVTLTPRP